MRKTKSSILAAVHETAVGLHKAGVMDQVTLREYVEPQRQARDHGAHQSQKVEAGRASMRAGQGRSNDEVEAAPAARRTGAAERS